MSTACTPWLASARCIAAFTRPHLHSEAPPPHAPMPRDANSPLPMHANSPPPTLCAPRPNNIACFGVATCSRLYMLIPHATQAVLKELTGGVSAAVARRVRMQVVGAAIAACALAQSNHESGARIDLAVPILVGMGAIYARAIVVHRHADDERTGMRPRHCFRAVGTGGTALVCIAFAYSFLLPMLCTEYAQLVPVGPATFYARDVLCPHRPARICMRMFTAHAPCAQRVLVLDSRPFSMGAPNMFSNLRMHGGSNHLLFPVGMAYRYMSWVAPSKQLSEAFGGGIVRVEHSNLAMLNTMYPGDLTGAFSVRSRERLAAAGHHPGFFVPMAGRTLQTDPGPPFAPKPSPLTAEFGFVPFTLRALDLRRILADVRAASLPFTLTYTTLVGNEGGEAWRKYSRGEKTVTVTDDGTGSRTCTHAISPTSTASSLLSRLGGAIHTHTVGDWPCGDEELPMLPAPTPVGEGFGIEKLLFSKPLPVLEGWDEEMVCCE